MSTFNLLSFLVDSNIKNGTCLFEEKVNFGGFFNEPFSVQLKERNSHETVQYAYTVFPLYIVTCTLSFLTVGRSPPPL